MQKCKFLCDDGYCELQGIQCDLCYSLTKAFTTALIERISKVIINSRKDKQENENGD